MSTLKTHLVCGPFLLDRHFCEFLTFGISTFDKITIRSNIVVCRSSMFLSKRGWGGKFLYDNLICEAGSRLLKVLYLVWSALSTPPTVWWGQLLICSRPLWRWWVQRCKLHQMHPVQILEWNGTENSYYFRVTGKGRPPQRNIYSFGHCA